jgi:hypothetical protein
VFLIILNSRSFVVLYSRLLFHLQLYLKNLLLGNMKPFEYIINSQAWPLETLVVAVSVIYEIQV